MSNSYSHEDDMPESPEFWFFTIPSPLPSLNQIKEIMHKAAPDYVLESSGNIETLKDCMALGHAIYREAGDAPQDEEKFQTALSIEVLDAKKLFGKNPAIMKDIGKRTQMVRVAPLDPVGLGHAFSFVYALTTLVDGLLVLPCPPDEEEEGDLLIEGKEASAFLKEHLDSLDLNDILEEYEDDWDDEQ